jgi:hypothetical protein
MNLREAAQQLQKEPLKEPELQSALLVLEQGWQSVLPYLETAYLRLQLGPLTLPGLLKNYSPKDLAKYIAPVFTSPSSPEEAKIQLLADLVISLLFPERKIDPIIWEALPEIEEAYSVILQSGGGWSSYESNPEKRKTAVLEWYRRDQARLSYLEEIYLDDPALYEGGGGQEKRNFITRLLIKIVKDKGNQELTFQKVEAHLKNLKDLKQPLRLEDL